MSDNLNLFETYAERTKPQHERRREATQRKARTTIRAKRNATLRRKQEERAKLERQYKLIGKEEQERLLTGPYALEFSELLGFLASLEHRSGQELVAFVKSWRRRWRYYSFVLPPQECFQALQLIDRAIMQLREARGLPPIDDALWDEKPTAFQLIRTELTP